MLLKGGERRRWEGNDIPTECTKRVWRRLAVKGLVGENLYSWKFCHIDKDFVLFDANMAHSSVGSVGL